MSSSPCGRQLVVPAARHGRLSRRRSSRRPWLWCVLLLLAFCVLLLSATGGDAGRKPKKPRKGGRGKGVVKLKPTPTKTPGVVLPRSGAQAPPDQTPQATEPATPTPQADAPSPQDETPHATASGTPTPQADAPSPQPAVMTPLPYGDAVTLESTAVFVGAFFSQHALVVRTLGGIARTLERYQSDKDRTKAVKDVQRKLNPSFTLHALDTTVNTIRVMMDALVGSGQCSTFFHHVPTSSTWVVHCWTGLLLTYHEPATFVIPHVLLGWPVPARAARPGWDWLALDPLPPLIRRHRTLPVKGDDGAEARDKQRNRSKKAKNLAKARSEVVKELAKAVKAAQQMRDKAVKVFSRVEPEKETKDEYQDRLKLAKKVWDAAKKRAEEDLKQARSDAEELLDDSAYSPMPLRVKAQKDAAARIRAAEAAYIGTLARAQRAYEAAVADALKWRKKAIQAVMSAAKATHSAACAEALAMEARARSAMDMAIAELELKYKDAIMPPTSRRMSVAPAAASTLSLDGPAASRLVIDFDLPPAEPTEVTDIWLVPEQTCFFFEAPSSTTDLSGLIGDSFQGQYLQYGYGLPFDSDMCAYALDSGDLCAYACCQTRMLGTASCEPTTDCL